ncbi:hypothetical protein Tsubulata_023310, partial [Turnera subulata]
SLLFSFSSLAASSISFSSLLFFLSHLSPPASLFIRFFFSLFSFLHLFFFFFLIFRLMFFFLFSFCCFPYDYSKKKMTQVQAKRQSID